jgi:hypothetical protein
MLCVRAAYHNKGVFDEAHIFQTIFFLYAMRGSCYT